MKKLRTGLLVVGVLILVAVGFYLAAPRVITPKRPTLASAGGTRVTLQVDPTLDDMAAAKAAKADAEVIERRLDAMRWHDGSVHLEGARRLVVELPGVYDAARVARIVAARGDLSIRLVLSDAPPGAPKLAAIDEGGEALAVGRRRIIDGSQVVSARPGFDKHTNQPIINVKLDTAGGQAFARETEASTGARVAIVLDDKILMAPRILGPILGGAVQISGNFTIEQTVEIAAQMGAGKLPAPLKVESTEQIAKR